MKRRNINFLFLSFLKIDKFIIISSHLISSSMHSARIDYNLFFYSFFLINNS